MLNVDRFKERAQGCEIFLSLFDFLIAKAGGEITEKQTKEERRLTSYLDTPEMALCQLGYALRLREVTGGAPEIQVNLKYRARTAICLRPRMYPALKPAIRNSKKTSSRHS